MAGALDRRLYVSTDKGLFQARSTDSAVWITEDGGESFRQALAGLPPVTAVSVAYA